MSDDYYAILGVARTSDQKTIKAAYRKLAPTKHPDRNKRPNATADFQRLLEAYETLSDPHKRQSYDATVHPQRSRAYDTPHTQSQPPRDNEKQRRIAELKERIKKLKTTLNELQTILDCEEKELDQLHREICRIEAERQRLTREKAADETWSGYILASATGRTAELSQRKRLRDNRMTELIGRKYTKEKLCRDKVVEINALRRRISVDHQKVSQLRTEILLGDETFVREVMRRFRMARRYHNEFTPPTDY